MSENDPVTYFALYRSDESGPIDADDGISAICVGLFTDYHEALTLARENLAEGYSISIDMGAMPRADWEALEEVPDDFIAGRKSSASADASDPYVGHAGNPSQRV